MSSTPDGNVRPVALTISASDASGASGIQADLKTFGAHGVYGVSAVTAVTAGVDGVETDGVEAGPSLIKEQLRVVFAHFPIRAAKVGALSSEHAVRVVAEGIEPYRGLNERRIRVVMDAGLVNGKGERVVDKKTQAQLTHRLFPLADLICCNLDEVEIFLGTSVSDYQEMKAAAQQLSEAFETGVLVKGGHLKDDNATDVLCHGGGVFRIETPRVGGLRTHGIGATLSAAITANLAHGLGIEEAVNTAKRYVAHLLPHCIEWKCPDEEVQETIQVVDQFAVEMLLGSEEDTAD